MPTPATRHSSLYFSQGLPMTTTTVSNTDEYVQGRGSQKRPTRDQVKNVLGSFKIPIADSIESLHEEKKLIENGVLKEDNPLDNSENFHRLCEACRRGDLKVCQEMITQGANINAKDLFDYTPLILVS
jgi:hypothetical protein